MELPPEERRHYAVLRLPFGTGNDGSDGRDLRACLGRLLGPCVAAPRTAILDHARGRQGGKKPIWSFNIASFGADAFIAHMTNGLKTVFPGDFYKLWVDIASVFYDLAWPSRDLGLRPSRPRARPGARVPPQDSSSSRSAPRATGSTAPTRPSSPTTTTSAPCSRCPCSASSRSRARSRTGEHEASPRSSSSAPARIELDYARPHPLPGRRRDHALRRRGLPHRRGARRRPLPLPNPGLGAPAWAIG